MVKHKQYCRNRKLKDVPYKGFLLIECEECGKLNGFCAREEITSCECYDCGHVIQLEAPPTPLYIRCKCGKSFRYRTNITEAKVITYKCLECGAPVDLVRNKKGTAYVMIGDADI